MNSKVLSFVNKMEGWKTAIKSLHWDSKNLSQHKLCDDIADRIADFQDQVSEVEQSISGKLPLNQLKGSEYNITSLKGFVEDVISDATSFLKDMESEGDKYIGMRSDCESFLSDMQRNLYLVNFTLKEELKRRLVNRLNESMPKSLDRHDEVDKFMGRKPKTMKARINQIYRIVKKYGIDSRLYTDEHWQAIEDYYKAITSLGCEVEMKPCSDIRHIDNLESDGGYCDYGEDGMPRSKQYAIRIMYDDGMNIDGYIKCMSAGTVSDPFLRYDTCIMLWPKNNRELALESMRMKKFTHNGENSYLTDEDPREFWNNRGEELGGRVEESVYRLTEDELHQLVSEAVTRLVYEGGRERANTANFVKSTHGHRTGKKKQKPAKGDFGEREKRLIGQMAEEKSVADREKRMQNQMSWGDFKQQNAYDDFDKESDLINKGAKYQAHTHDLHREDPETWKRVTGVRESEIKIKPSKEGTFTAAAKKHGKSVQGFASQVLNNKDNYSPAMVKKANFARNASKWNKK